VGEHRRVWPAEQEPEHDTKLVLSGPVTASSAQFIAPLAAVLILCRYTYRPDAENVNGYEVLETAVSDIVYRTGEAIHAEASFVTRTSTFRKWSTQQSRVK
jgi:hypothetical protein